MITAYHNELKLAEPLTKRMLWSGTGLERDIEGQQASKPDLGRSSRVV